MTALSPVSVMKHSSRAMIGALGILVASSTVVAAQTGNWELRFTTGALLPTGDQRHFLKDAQLSAAQLAWVVRPSLALTGMFAWARSRDLAVDGTPKVDVFTSDLGVEARSSEWFADRAVTLRTFAGIGGGARSYNYRTGDVDATNNLAGYGAAGGELGIGRVGVRLEARNYVTGFKPLLTPGASDRRNDVVVMGTLRFNHKRAGTK